MSNKKYPRNVIKVNDKEIPYHKINHDVNGNPRYVVHFLDLGVKPTDYGKNLSIGGLSKYRAKWFGGGYVIQSYNLEEDLKYYLDQVELRNNIESYFDHL